MWVWCEEAKVDIYWYFTSLFLCLPNLAEPQKQWSSCNSPHILATVWHHWLCLFAVILSRIPNTGWRWGVVLCPTRPSLSAAQQQTVAQIVCPTLLVTSLMSPCHCVEALVRTQRSLKVSTNILISNCSADYTFIFVSLKLIYKMFVLNFLF